ncbi:porin family protein [Hymenobacter negativus]|uniref:PorT family protein n=1 Tax=Hymenobacter negativus TaxID=2795026 RepID=A0ABS3QA64_9BACT|nr:porin family protein [Hymenobacter negativus]MBO2007600.1 PorT family protein [Hymenobacter negativus]
MKMLVYVALLPIGTGVANAQDGFSFGPQLGGNLSILHASTHATTLGQLRPGFEAGVLAAWQHQHWSLQSGLCFSQQGTSNYARPYTLVAESIDYRLNYLQLPLAVAYALRPTGRGLQVFAGPYLSLLVGGKQDTRAGNAPVVSTPVRRAGGTPSYDNAVYTQGLDAGLQAGLGYRTERLLFQASASLGLRDLSVSPADVLHSPYYSRGLRLSVAYLFPPKS